MSKVRPTGEKVVFVAWKDFYSVKNEELDGHHKKIVLMVNELYDALENGTEREVIRSLLNALVDYTKFHFAREEELMAECEFPDLPSHKLSHETMVWKTNRLAMQSDNVSGQDLLRFLKTWFVNHICGEDKQYSPFMQRLARAVPTASA
jgi:hemerythrin